MESVYVKLNNVQTNLLTWGDPFDSNNSDVIICITGNPGIPHFYEEFATELNKSTGLPVCVIDSVLTPCTERSGRRTPHKLSFEFLPGQAGHVEVPEEKSNVLERQEHLFNLEGQVQHKLDLICNKIYKHRKLHLIGHSIGAWLILEAINKREDLMERIRSISLLFPTIERMAETPNGRFLNGVVRRLHSVAILLFTLIHILPDGIKRFLVGCYLKWNGLPRHYSERILKFLRPRVGEKVLHMAYDEMDRVVAPPAALARVAGAEGAPAGAGGAPAGAGGAPAGAGAGGAPAGAGAGGAPAGAGAGGAPAGAGGAPAPALVLALRGARDGWAPARRADCLRRLRPGLRLERVHIDHAFVLTSSERVARIVSDFIKPKIHSCSLVG